MKNKGRTWRKRLNKNDGGKVSLAHTHEYIALFQWAKQNGVFFHKMKPVNFPDTGRGLMATKQIKVGDLLISVPKKLLITQQMLRNSYFDGQNKTETPNLNTMELLCLFLIVERNLGDKSFWSPYISMLPSIFNTPAYFTYHELKYTPEFFAEEGRSQLNSIQKCFSSLKQFMSNCSKKMRDVRFTFDDVRWAWNAVNTRCVYMNKELKFNTAFQQNDSISCCLAPLLDLLNHSCAVQIDAGFSETEQCYQIFTKTKFNKGDQVFINYGPHNNRKLLIEYGFILPYNCHNSVKIQPNLVYHIVTKLYGNISKRKWDIISKYNLAETYYFSPTGLSWSLETALKVFSLNDDQQSFCIDTQELSIENENMVKLSLREILKCILEEYSRDRTTIWSNGDEGLSERMKILATLLQQEMSIVEHALVALK